jgi:hypothetical protein
MGRNSGVSSAAGDPWLGQRLQEQTSSCDQALTPGEPPICAAVLLRARSAGPCTWLPFRSDRAGCCQVCGRETRSATPLLDGAGSRSQRMLESVRRVLVEPSVALSSASRAQSSSVSVSQVQTWRSPGVATRFPVSTVRRSLRHRLRVRQRWGQRRGARTAGASQPGRPLLIR